jgi:hypothetical protein
LPPKRPTAMRKKLPLLLTLSFIVFLLASCGAPHIRPGYGSYKGYKHRKYYKHMKPDYVNPKMKKYKKN